MALLLEVEGQTENPYDISKSASSTYKFPDLETWLHDLKLSHIYPALREEDFETLKTLVALNEDDLDELCVEIKTNLKKINKKFTLGNKGLFKSELSTEKEKYHQYLSTINKGNSFSSSVIYKKKAKNQPEPEPEYNDNKETEPAPAYSVNNIAKEPKEKHPQIIILENEHLRQRSVTFVTADNNEFINFLRKILKSKLNEKIWNKCDPNNTEKIETEKFMDFWTLPVTLFKVAIFQRKNKNKQKPKLDQKEIKKDFMHLATWIVRRYGQKQSDGGATFVLIKANFAKNIVDYVKSYADAKGELYEKY